MTRTRPGLWRELARRWAAIFAVYALLVPMFVPLAAASQRAAIDAAALCTAAMGEETGDRGTRPTAPSLCCILCAPVAAAILSAGQPAPPSARATGLVLRAGPSPRLLPAGTRPVGPGAPRGPPAG